MSSTHYGIGLGLGGSPSLIRGSHVASYDENAQAYFDAVEAAGGSFDLTSEGATYTEGYTKGKLNDLFVALAPEWDNISQLLINSAKTSDGLGVAAKGEDVTVLNFSSGSYNPVGSSIGLQTTSGLRQQATISTAANQNILPPANKDNVTFAQIVTVATSTGTSTTFDRGFNYAGENYTLAGQYQTNLRYDRGRYVFGNGFYVYNDFLLSPFQYGEGLWTFSNDPSTTLASVKKNGSGVGTDYNFSGAQPNYTGVYSPPANASAYWNFNDGGNGGRFALLMIFKDSTLPSSFQPAFKAFLNAFGDTSTIP